jgi:hypothetical protein
MTEKFVQFDEKSGRFKVFPGAKRDLMALQEETGYAYNDLVKMGEGMAKLKIIQGEFKIGAFDKEDSTIYLPMLLSSTKKKVVLLLS